MKTGLAVWLIELQPCIAVYYLSYCIQLGPTGLSLPLAKFSICIFIKTMLEQNTI